MHNGTRRVLLRILHRTGRIRTGSGTRYRATIIGPGVTPDIYWQAAAPGAYDRERWIAPPTPSIA